MNNDKGITQYFGVNLAELLADKILNIYKSFDRSAYIDAIACRVQHLGYTERIALHATELRTLLPEDYESAIGILLRILGDENPDEVGMFSRFYWTLPLGKFVELYGLGDVDVSLHAIGEITKRGTGEYAVRPFLRAHTEETLNMMRTWAQSRNFHERRLASEGSRPKLPWATKLDLFVQNPAPVFEILSLLKEDTVRYVGKSVANNLTDYLKVNPDAARALLKEWSCSTNPHTQWIVRHATRKIPL
jgi:3-methyladenine DNA glycosylase AlkC